MIHPSPRHRSRVVATTSALVIGLAVATMGVAASPAQAYIYWFGDARQGEISTAQDDGTNPQGGPIVDQDHGGALAAAGGYVYWLSCTDQQTGVPGCIKRARPDGSGLTIAPTPSYQSTLGTTFATDGTYLYWPSTAPVGFDQRAAIVRANADGSGVVDPLVVLPAGQTVVSLATGHGYIYWLAGDANASSVTIGRATTDGSSVTGSLVTQSVSSDLPVSLAVGPSRIYWTEAKSPWIGSASLDGAASNPTFLNIGSGEAALAADGNYLYWADNGIGRAGLDGSDVRPTFVLPDPNTLEGGDVTGTLAVDSGSADGTSVESVNCLPARAGSTDSTHCTASVVDTSAAPSPVHGTLTFGGGVKCTLSVAASAGISSCTSPAFTHIHGWPSQSPPITITYSGESQHLPSSTTDLIPVINSSGGSHGGRGCRLTNVVGLPRAKALAKLIRAHCRVVIRTRRTTAARAGHVLAQTPATINARQLPAGTRVTLIVGTRSPSSSRRATP